MTRFHNSSTLQRSTLYAKASCVGCALCDNVVNSGTRQDSIQLRLLQHMKDATSRAPPWHLSSLVNRWRDATFCTPKMWNATHRAENDVSAQPSRQSHHHYSSPERGIRDGPMTSTRTCQQIGGVAKDGRPLRQAVLRQGQAAQGVARVIEVPRSDRVRAGK